MKAAVLHQYGHIPKYEDYNDPLPQNEQQILVTVKAAAVKQLDKSKASGKHYTSYGQLPSLVGTDGTGILADGTKIYANGITGMIAEKALIHANSWVKLPDNLDFGVAAALPNALFGSDAALLCRAGFNKGDVILVSGATGITGKMAVQVAKLRGASKVIAMGRNEAILNALKQEGADEIISLSRPDEVVIQKVKEIHSQTPIDIVLDYLWGHPMELILAGIKDVTPRKVKVVTIGEMAGANISLLSGILRSTKIELIGSGIGSISMPEVVAYMKNELPAMLQAAADNKLHVEIDEVPLAGIETAWQHHSEKGKRLVVRM